MRDRITNHELRQAWLACLSSSIAGLGSDKRSKTIEDVEEAGLEMADSLLEEYRARFEDGYVPEEDEIEEEEEEEERRPARRGKR